MSLRVAVIGCGNIGRTHASVYADDPLAELVAVCDLDRERADQVAAQFNVRAFYDVPSLLDGAKPDLVSVATAGEENGSHHYEPTMQVLNRGIHVLCEKPISNDIREAREMVAKAQEQGVYFAIDLNHRFTPAAERAKQLVENGELGELLFCNMALWINNPRDTTPWFHLRALHPHSIDVMRYFLGDVAQVQAFLKRSGKRVNWSNASINMQFASGAIGHLTGSYDMSTLHPIERCEVAGTKGRFVIDNVFESLTFYPRESPEVRVMRNSIMGRGMASFRETFQRRIHRFLEQVTAGVPREEVEGSGAEGLAAQEVVEAAIRSWRERRIVEVPVVHS